MNPKILHLQYPLIIASCLNVFLSSFAVAAQDLEEPLVTIQGKKNSTDTAEIYFEAESLDKDHLYVRNDNLSTTLTTKSAIKSQSLKALMQRLILATKKMNSSDPLTRARAKKEYIIIRQFIKHINKGNFTIPKTQEELAIVDVESSSIDDMITYETDEPGFTQVAEEIHKAPPQEKLEAKVSTQKSEEVTVEKKKVEAKKEFPKEEVAIKPAVEKPVVVKEKIEKPSSKVKAFSTQKGSLPWPVSGRKIVSTFGVRPNAQSLGLPIENFGVDLYVSPSSSIRAVHDGKVLFVTIQPPYETIIAIDHGGYTSVYYFLDQVNVARGATVKAGQTIGKVIARDQSPNFHFEIWRGQEQINPLPWLSK